MRDDVASEDLHPLLKEIRSWELERVRPFFSVGDRVVEIGGNDGWQASKLTELVGHEVASFDIAPVDQSRLQHSVQTYDGTHLPLLDASIDVVFSSNTLEHVVDLQDLFAEMRRVLIPDGRAVHVLPTPAWRFWTILTRYVYLIQLILGRRKVPPRLAGTTQRRIGVHELRESGSIRGPLALIRMALIEKPHGEFPTAISELFYYRASWWRQQFEAAGFEVVRVHRAGLFYTGYGVCPSLSLNWRQRVARIAGSACQVFVLRKI